ncbi:uncharacterized protein G2W53_033526 [Senna tora]|uniref:Uncharacterized protein n=1 Tax=Senna tora TaxID=362788 RepID=A0A834T0Q9_9FABA|nr:uncharacterized protein G2W53_033526 [Senna tora]
MAQLAIRFHTALSLFHPSSKDTWTRASDNHDLG